jgi:hypothetical protein
MSGDVCFVEAERVHVRSQTIGGRLQSRVQPRNPVGLSHVEEIDGVYA